MSDRLSTFKEFTESLLASIDIVDIVNSRLPLRKKSNNNYFACCPFHQEKSASFSVSEPKQFYYCFGCGAHGNAIDFLMRFEHLSFMEALTALASLAGMTVPRFREQGNDERAASQSLEEAYSCMEEAVQFYYQTLKQSPRAIDYLKERGISGEIARLFKLGYAPPGWHSLLDHFPPDAKPEGLLLDNGLIIKKNNERPYDRFRDRIMFPIQDHRGRFIGFGGRVLDQGEPKYLNSPETPLFQKGHTCYGLHQILSQHPTLEKVVIVEGYMDVIALFQHGINYAIATLGTATTPHHIKRLLRYTHQFYFCFDGDEAGRRAARRALETLFPLLNDEWHVRFLFLPEQEDPDSIVRKEGKQGFEARLQNAVSLSDFFLDTMALDTDLSTMEGRAAMTARSLSLIQLLPAILLKEVLLAELSKRVRLEVAQLNAKLSGEEITFNGTKKTFPASLSSRNQVKTRPPLYKVLALLVQHPRLVTLLPDELPNEQHKAWQLLRLLAATLFDKSSIVTTGVLLERLREHAELESIIKLANWPLEIPEDGLEAEFQGALEKALLHVQLDNKINQLMAKATIPPGLNEEEKQQLLLWIKQQKKVVIHEKT